MTPIERLTALTAELMTKHSTVTEELKNAHNEIAACRNNTQSKEEEIELFTTELAEKDREIERLKGELSAKDNEIEAIVAKIESLLG